MQNIGLFFKAIWLTLKGERPPQSPHQSLKDWISTGIPLAEAALQSVNHNFTIKVDGRNQSIQTILKGVVYHLSQEYPYLLQHLTEHSLLAIRASNLNDQYAIKKLMESSEIVPFETLIKNLDSLRNHLFSIPEADNSSLKSEK